MERKKKKKEIPGFIRARLEQDETASRIDGGAAKTLGSTGNDVGSDRGLPGAIRSGGYRSLRRGHGSGRVRWYERKEIESSDRTRGEGRRRRRRETSE